MLTVKGVTITSEKGEENYEMYYSEVLKRDLVQYDYRDYDGQLFSCVGKTLEDCREKRQNWLAKKEAA